VSADPWGIADGYFEIGGAWRPTSPETRARLLDAMGATPDAPPPASAVAVLRRGGPPPPVREPTECVLEDGTSLRVDGGIPPDLPLGYHVLRALERDAATQLIVAPGHCYLPDGLRTWGWALQLYALRSRASWGIGDLADLRRFARWSAARGAGAIVLNPLHAVLPIAPQEASPYFPSSRRYRNPLYLRVEEVAGARDAGVDLDALARLGRALDAERRIDRDRVLALKMAALERVWAAGAGRSPALARYRAAQGPALEEFATFCVLAERHRAGWRRWPAEHRHPASPAVRRFAAEHADRVAYHAWLQWCLDEQLGRAGEATRLITDLAIGFDGEGADGWAWQDVLADGATVGAPPDDFALEGQDWGLPPFVPHRLRASGHRPFVETVRAGLRHAGGVRIDHVMGLFRLFWIPRGSTAAGGGYVRYPTDELLAILALESERARALIVGEDLGTVEEGVRERMAAERILSYRVFYFEPRPPASYPGLSLASVTTHDLPTVTGLWTGSDLTEQVAAGLTPNPAATEALREHVRTLTGVERDAPAESVARAAHHLLAQAPSVVVVATLEDALGVAERPNLPGTTSDRRPNWALALPRSLEDIEADARVRATGEALARGPAGRSAEESPPAA
jgi:4-alpha-glucanotransferase